MNHHDTGPWSRVSRERDIGAQLRRRRCKGQVGQGGPPGWRASGGYRRRRPPPARRRSRRLTTSGTSPDAATAAGRAMRFPRRCAAGRARPGRAAGRSGAARGADRLATEPGHRGGCRSTRRRGRLLRVGLLAAGPGRRRRDCRGNDLPRGRPRPARACSTSRDAGAAARGDTAVGARAAGRPPVSGAATLASPPAHEQRTGEQGEQGQRQGDAGRSRPSEGGR